VERTSRPPELESAARRHFLSSTMLGGTWILGTGSLPKALAQANGSAVAAVPASGSTPSSRDGTGAGSAPGFGIWLRFAPDGAVTALTNISNLGQGTHSAIAQIVAEELAMPLAMVTIEQAPVEPAFANREFGGYATLGSSGFTSAYLTLAPVCAAARDRLVRAAAARWAVPAGECVAKDAQVRHAAREAEEARSAPYSELLLSAAALTPQDKLAGALAGRAGWTRPRIPKQGQRPERQGYCQVPARSNPGRRPHLRRAVPSPSTDERPSVAWHDGTSRGQRCYGSASRRFLDRTTRRPGELQESSEAAL
jgi:hypothetical protein